jgi:hypothetical protein
MRSFLRKGDVDAIFANLYLEGFDSIVVIAGRLSGQRMEVPAVPRTAKHTLFDRALPERPALMRAFVVEGPILPLEVGQTERAVLAGDRFDSPLRELVYVEDL